MIDHDKLGQANNRLDAKFAADHKDFVTWWHRHDHCDPDPKYAIPARVAWKAQCYRQEYLGAKEVGAAT